MAQPLSTKTQLIGTLTITGTNPSAWLSSDAYFQYDSLLIISPDTAFAGTVTLEVANGHTADSPGSFVLQSPIGTDISPVTNRAFILTELPATGIRLDSSGNETTPLVFTIWGRQRP